MGKSYGYRVALFRGEVAVFELFYDETGQVDGFTEAPVSPAAESIEGLRQELELMLKCLEQPVLDHPDG
jgi:hypothetical protein